MNVDDLQMHLSNLSQLLRGAGAKPIANDLDEVCQQLQPYREMAVKKFFGLIQQAETTLAKESAKKSAATTAKAEAAETFRRLAARIVELHQQTRNGAPVSAELETAVDALAQLKPKKPQLEALAQQAGLTQRFANPAEYLAALANRPIPAKTTKAKDEGAVREAGTRVVNLYHRAGLPETSIDDLEAAVTALEKANPTVAQLSEICAQIGVAMKGRAKGDFLKKIRLVLLDRKGASERVVV